MKPVQVFVVDDHELVRRGVKDLLDASSQFELCGEAANGREALAAIQALRPQIVLMDVSMPEMNGLEATRQILKALPETQVLILTIHENEELVREVVRCGARGYLHKADTAAELLVALESLAQHQPYFTPRVSDLILRFYLQQSKQGEEPSGTRSLLSAREREITQLVAEGLSSRDIAARLGIHVKTAESHRVNIMRKIEVHSVSELVRYAVRNGIVQA